MPNRTVLEIANDCLQACGCAPIASAAIYPNVTDKYQKQLTIMLRLVQHKMALRFNKHFNVRKFQFNTVPPDANNNPTQWYVLPNATIEGFKANTFFNITINGTYTTRVTMRTYEWWRQTWPDPTAEPLGPPIHIIPMDDDGSGECRVMLWPWADAVYTVEGQCRVVCPQILDGNSRTIFPAHYDHVLVLKGMEMLETRLNEGREQSIGAIADEAISEVMQDASGSYEENEPIDIGCRLYGYYSRDSVRDYNPATDTVPPYS